MASGQGRLSASRREALAGMALFAAVAGVPALARPVADRRLKLLREVAQLVIPKTDTPGAGEVGVAAFVVLALEHGLEGSGPADAAWLAGELDRRCGGDFLSRPLAQKQPRLPVEGTLAEGAPAGDGGRSALLA